MSDWMLYHVWGIRGYRTVGMEKLNPRTSMATLEPLPSVYRCARCGSKDVIRKGTVSRMFLGTPVGQCRMYFEAAIPRVHCGRCKITRQVRVPFAEEKHRHTRQFERYALDLARITTTQHAAEHLGVAWGTVRDIEVRYLSRKYKKPKLRHLRHIAIDEIYLGKRMKFVTLVLDLDLESGAIVYVGNGKSAESLDPFWKRLRGSGGNVPPTVAVGIGASREAEKLLSSPKSPAVFGWHQSCPSLVADEAESRISCRESEGQAGQQIF